MEQILNPEAFKPFIHGSIFDKAVFCLGGEQGMLVNDECSSWYMNVIHGIDKDQIACYA